MSERRARLKAAEAGEQGGDDEGYGPPMRQPCVGLPVQYSNGIEVLPAVLQRQSRANPAFWDLKVSLSGATSLVTRAAVPFSPDGPKTGHWNFLPV